MISNGSSKVSTLNKQMLDEGSIGQTGVGFLTDGNGPGGHSNVSAVGSVCVPRVDLEQGLAISPRFKSLPPSPSSPHERSQLHRRVNSPRQCGSEHIPLRPLFGQPSRAANFTSTEVTSNLHGKSSVRYSTPFATSTSVQSPSRKIFNGEPGAAGLRLVEIDDGSLYDDFDDVDLSDYADSDSHHRAYCWEGEAVASGFHHEIVISQDSFAPIAIEVVDSPESDLVLGPTTPLLQAFAGFHDLFSSTFTASPSLKSPNPNDSSSNALPFRFRFPTSPLQSTDFSTKISNAFNLSTMMDSISQLRGDIATSFAGIDYEFDGLFQDQYHEDAVARNEEFHWEDEMRCLEVQNGL